MDQIKIGCNGIIVKDNRLLLGLRKNIFGDGTYGLPGGHLEYKEKLIDAIKRELKEEVGVEASELELVSILDQIKPDKHYIQINFVVKQFSGEIQNMEPERCGGWEWFDLDKLPENIFPPHTDIIEAFKEKKLYFY